MTNPSSYLATNLKNLRRSRDVTQSQLSRRAQIPRSTLASLEVGGSNPTLSVLTSLSEALSVPVQELLSKPRAQVRHYPRSSLKESKRGKALVRHLLPDSIPGMEIDRMSLKPGALVKGVPHRAGTREYMSCEVGRVQLTVAGETFDVKEGEVVVFAGNQAHSYRNLGERTAVVYSVVVLIPY